MQKLFVLVEVGGVSFSLIAWPYKVMKGKIQYLETAYQVWEILRVLYFTYYCGFLVFAVHLSSNSNDYL